MWKLSSSRLDTKKLVKNHQAASDDWWTLITAGFGSVNWKFVGLTSDNSV